MKIKKNCLLLGPCMRRKLGSNVFILLDGGSSQLTALAVTSEE